MIYSLERTGITDASAKQLLDSLPKLRELEALNISSNSFTVSFFDSFIRTMQVLAGYPLKYIDISNNKLGDTLAQRLIFTILKDPQSIIESLDLSRNGLGFKTGAFVMTLLVD